jgi:hypothetical protein
MKNISIGFIIGVIVMAFLYKSCNNKQTQTITIPETISDFETKTDIANTPISSKDLKPIIKEVPKWYKDTRTDKELKQQLSEQEKRLKLYEEEISHAIDFFQFQDSLTKAKLYAECNKLNSFSETFEDSLSKLTLKGIVQGKLKEIKPYLLIKKREVNLPLKKNRLFSLSAGIGGNFTSTIPVYTFGVGYKNFEFDFLKIDNQNFGTAKYRIRF